MDSEMEKKFCLEQAEEHSSDTDIHMNSEDDNNSEGSVDEGYGRREKYVSSSDSSFDFGDPASVYTSEHLTPAPKSLKVPEMPTYKTLATIVPLSYLPQGDNDTETKIIVNLSPRDIEYVSLTRENRNDNRIYPTAIVLRMFSLLGDMVAPDSPRMIDVWVNDKTIREKSNKWWITNDIKLCPFLDNLIELVWCNSTIKKYLITLEIAQTICGSSGNQLDVNQFFSSDSDAKKINWDCDCRLSPIHYEVVDLTEDDDKDEEHNEGMPLQE